MTVLHPVEMTFYAFVLLLYNNQRETRTPKVLQPEKHYPRLKDSGNNLADNSL